MPRVLTVDDSRAIRQIVSKQLAELGCETDEAEDGEKGLQRLAEVQFDLVVLDVTMPVMDGPEMLKRMRAAGNRTPVIMLTSESKSSIVAGAMKLGIEEYILKPFKPEELRAKVQKLIRLDPPKAAPVAVAAAPVVATGAAPTASAAPSAGGKSSVDVLVIDDMENVQKKLRTMLPAHLSLHGCVNAQAAVSLCRENVYRVILLDTVIPEVNSVALMNQLRALQSNAKVLALMLRTTGDPEKEVRAQGYDGFLFKPFDATSLDDLVVRHFDIQAFVTTEGNVMSAHGFNGREDRVDAYFTRVGALLRAEMDKVAAACHDEVIVDLTETPVRPDKTTRFLIGLGEQASRVGLSLRVVGPSELHKWMNDFAETASIPFYTSVAAATGGTA